MGAVSGTLYLDSDATPAGDPGKFLSFRVRKINSRASQMWPRSDVGFSEPFCLVSDICGLGEISGPELRADKLQRIKAQLCGEGWEGVIKVLVSI